MSQTSSQDSPPAKPDSQYLSVLRLLAGATADPALKENRIGSKFLVDSLIGMEFELAQVRVVVSSLRHQQAQLRVLCTALYAQCIHNELQRGIDDIVAKYPDAIARPGPTLFDINARPSAPPASEVNHLDLQAPTLPAVSNGAHVVP